MGEECFPPPASMFRVDHSVELVAAATHEVQPMQCRMWQPPTQHDNPNQWGNMKRKRWQGWEWNEGIESNEQQANSTADPVRAL